MNHRPATIAALLPVLLFGANVALAQPDYLVSVQFCDPGDTTWVQISVKNVGTTAATDDTNLAYGVKSGGSIQSANQIVIPLLPGKEFQSSLMQFPLNGCCFGETDALPNENNTANNRDDVCDSDLDGLIDVNDNCILVSNADQRDTNGDDIGNICDPDLDNDAGCDVDFSDVSLMKQSFLSSDPDSDLDGDGVVGFLDLGIMKEFFLGPPGPSANGCN